MSSIKESQKSVRIQYNRNPGIFFFKCKRFITTSACTQYQHYIKNTSHIKTQIQISPHKALISFTTKNKKSRRRFGGPTLLEGNNIKEHVHREKHQIGEKPKWQTLNYLALTKIEINLKILSVLQGNKRLHKKDKNRFYIYIYIYIFIFSKEICYHKHVQAGLETGVAVDPLHLARCRLHAVHI